MCHRVYTPNGSSQLIRYVIPGLPCKLGLFTLSVFSVNIPGKFKIVHQEKIVGPLD